MFCTKGFEFHFQAESAILPQNANSPNFYDPASLIEAWQEADIEEQENLLNEFEDHKQKLRAQKEGVSHDGCQVFLTTWINDGRKSEPRTETIENCTILVKGRTAWISCPDGREFQKRLGSQGFYFLTGAEVREREEIRLRVLREKRLTKRELLLFMKGKRFESCDYFDWRDKFGRNSHQANWTPITHKLILALAEESGLQYLKRTVRRFVDEGREVVRVGLHHGVRVKKTEEE